MTQRGATGAQPATAPNVDNASHGVSDGASDVTADGAGNGVPGGATRGTPHARSSDERRRRVPSATSTDDVGRVAFVEGGTPGWHGWVEARRSAIAWSVVALAIILPLRGLYVATGASMEEGFMLVFPDLVQQGKVPNVDFLHLYGPASLGSLALWFRIFGDTLEAQRVFGFGQHILILSGLYTLGRVAGRKAAAGTALVAALFVLTPIGLTALAWHGAVGLGLWAVVFACRYRSTGSARDLWWCGGLIGLALSFRPDLFVACALLVAWVVWSSRPSLRRSVVGVIGVGGAVGLIPIWVHMVIAGPITAFDGMFIDPVFRLRAGRELPRPPSWGHVDGALQAVAESLPPWWGLPALPASQQLNLWFWSVVIAAFGALAWSVWGVRLSRDDDRRAWSTLVAASLFGVGIVPQALQRPDSTHLAWVAMVSWPLLVPLGTMTLGRLDPTRPKDGPVGSGGGWVTRWAAPLSVATIAALMLVICPFYTYRTYVLHTRVAWGDLPVPFVIERGDHHFWVGDPAVARAMAQMIPELDARSEPGDRLFVGPGDLRKTVYADTYVYWLFSELEPSTYYIEMDPGLANAPGSGMADDVASADFVVLTNTWSGWIEPNTSVVFGSPESNEVIANQFCLVASYETNLILLFERCDGGGGLNPADVAGRAAGIGGGGVERSDSGDTVSDGTGDSGGDPAGDDPARDDPAKDGVEVGGVD